MSADAGRPAAADEPGGRDPGQGAQPSPETPVSSEAQAKESPEPVTDVPDGRQLMLAVSTDEPGAFERLVATYETRVKAGVARSIRDRSSVDDLAQEVFIRLFRSRHRYQPTARFETFLYRIIFNLCVNHTQYTARRRAASIDAPVAGDSESGWELPDERGDVPLEQLAADERARMVRAAVGELPDSQRRALMLNRFEGLGYEEIGQVMELSLQAVKSLLWRARENLRKQLQPILGQGDDSDG